MKKPEASDDLRDEYSLDDFPRGLERGKYAARMKRGSNIVRLDPENAKAFPDSKSVNEALQSLIGIAERSLRKGSDKRS